MSRVRHVLPVVAFALLASTRPAFAADPIEGPSGPLETPTRPSDHAYETGKAALRARAFDAAVDAFALALGQSSEDAEVWRALLGLALAYELSGDTLAGAVNYRRFLAHSAPSPLAAGSEWGPRRVEAAQSAERLEKSLAVTHANIVVTSTPAGARVTIAPRLPSACDTTPCQLFAPPGRYQVTLTHDDHTSGRERVDSYELDAVAGQRHEVSADFAPMVVVPETPPPTAAWPPAATWTLVGGGAALVTGAIFTGLAAGDHADLESLAGRPGSDEVLRDYDRARSRMESHETTAWVFYIVGGVAVVTGVILGISAGPERADGLALRF